MVCLKAVCLSSVPAVHYWYPAKTTACIRVLLGVKTLEGLKNTVQGVYKPLTERRIGKDVPIVLIIWLFVLISVHQMALHLMPPLLNSFSH